MKFGIQIIVQETIKILIIYLTAALLDVLIEVFIIHCTFFFIRQVSLGYHFSSKTICIIWSILLFPISYKLIQLSDYNYDFNWVITIVTSVLLAVIGPVSTSKAPIANTKHRKYLKKRLYVRLLILITIFSIIPDNVQVLLLTGLIIQLLMIFLQLIKNKKELITNANH